MSKPTASAAGGAMPAEGHKTRRAALALFGAAPALAILPAAAIASSLPTDADAELFELLAEWREADARAAAADRRVWEADDGTDIARPDVLIKTAEDAELFVTDEEIGEHYRRPKSFAAIEGTISIVMGHFFTHAPIVAMIKRFEEINAAHRAHEAAVQAAREAAGYPELVRLQDFSRAVVEWRARAGHKSGNRHCTDSHVLSSPTGDRGVEKPRLGEPHAPLGSRPEHARMPPRPLGRGVLRLAH